MTLNNYLLPREKLESEIKKPFSSKGNMSNIKSLLGSLKNS